MNEHHLPQLVDSPTRKYKSSESCMCIKESLKNSKKMNIVLSGLDPKYDDLSVDSSTKIEISKHLMLSVGINICGLK